MAEISIRAYEPTDADALWQILEPIVRGGQVFAFPRNLDREATFARWCGEGFDTFVAESNGQIIGTAYIRDNPLKPNCGVANAGYATRSGYEGRGVARSLCTFSLNQAAGLGFQEMQFNYVVSTNKRAVGLWKSLGFEITEVLEQDFRHPELGPVDAFVMVRSTK